MANMLSQLSSGLQTVFPVFQRRPSHGEREIIGTPSSLLSQIMVHFNYDVGLLTATGKTKLEEEHGLRIFEEMARDSQIKAALSVKKFAVLEGNWEIKPYDDSPAAREQADFIQWNLQYLLGDKGIGLEPVMTAFDYGRSVCEKVHAYQDFGKFKGKVYLKALKPKNIGFINYEVDEFDNVTRLLVSNLRGEMKKVDPRRVVMYSWNGQFGNPYGQSDLTSCYQWFWAKKTIYKYLMIFCDKYASPIPVVTTGKALSQTDRDELDTALKNYHISNYLRLPKGIELELHQNNGTAGQIFVNAMSFCNAEMARAILGQSLTINENQKTGTHAQAKVHQETMHYVLAKVQNDIERAVVQRQIIEPLIDMNYGKVEGYPSFNFASYDLESLERLAGIVSTLCNTVDNNSNRLLEPTEDWIRKRMNLPPRDTEEFPLRTEPLVVDNGNEGDSADKPADKKTDTPKAEKKPAPKKEKIKKAE